MNIRIIKPSDEIPFINMCQAFYTTDAVLLPISIEKIKATFKKALEDSPFLRLVFIEKENISIGYALFAFYWSNEAGGMVAQLEEIYILPEYRGQNCGNFFFEWMFETYSSEVARFRLEACKHNTPALNLYHKQGFKPLDYIQLIKE